AARSRPAQARQFARPERTWLGAADEPRPSASRHRRMAPGRPQRRRSARRQPCAVGPLQWPSGRTAGAIAMGVSGATDLQMPPAADAADEPQLRQMILDLVGEYARRYHAPRPFEPGTSPVPVSGKVYGSEDMQSLVDSALDF